MVLKLDSTCNYLFFPNLLIINTITTINATTINIPKPIPALKIPSIASHDCSEIEIRTSVINESGCIVFIIKCLEIIVFR